MNKAEMTAALAAGETRFTIETGVQRVDGGPYTFAPRVEVLKDGIEYEEQTHRFSQPRTMRDGVEVRKIGEDGAVAAETMVVRRRCITRTVAQWELHRQRQQEAQRKGAELAEAMNEMGARLGGRGQVSHGLGAVVLNENVARKLIEKLDRLESLEMELEHIEDTADPVEG